MQRVGDQICMNVPVCALASAFCTGDIHGSKAAVCASLQRTCPDQSWLYEPGWPCSYDEDAEYSPYQNRLYTKSLLGNNDAGGLGLSPFKTAPEQVPFALSKTYPAAEPGPARTLCGHA